MRSGMFQLLVCAGLLCSACGGIVRGTEIERWDRAICLYTDYTKPDGQPAFNLSTSFLVAFEQQLFLVTAAHAAKETGSATKVFYRRQDGAARWVLLKALNIEAGEPWKHHHSSDLSIMKLEPGRLEAEAQGLADLAISRDALLPETPARTTEIEIVGFPMTIGTQPEISPLVMKGAIASRELQWKNKWGAEPVVFAVPAVGSGTSGGPGFTAVADLTTVQVAGMYVGLQVDESGAKLSRLVPARIIRDLITDMAKTPTTETAEAATMPPGQ